MSQPAITSRDLSLASTILTAAIQQLQAADSAFSEDSQLLLDTLEGETNLFDRSTKNSKPSLISKLPQPRAPTGSRFSVSGSPA